jgi:hypothetical protein
MGDGQPAVRRLGWVVLFITVAIGGLSIPCFADWARPGAAVIDRAGFVAVRRTPPHLRRGQLLAIKSCFHVEWLHAHNP